MGNLPFGQLVKHPHEDIPSKFGVGHLSAPESYSYLYLVALFKKISNMFRLEFQIMTLDFGLHANFLQLNLRLVLFRITDLLFLLVNIFTVIKYLAYRGDCIR